MPPAATTSAQALSNLQTAQAGQQTPDQLTASTGSALGIPAAQQQVSGLRGAINNTTQLLSQVAPSVMGRTQNSLVTSAQADAQIANGQAPLNDQLNKENTDYSGASSDLTNLLGQQNTEVGNDLSNQQNQLSYLQGIYSDLSASEQQKVANEQAEEQLSASRAAAASSGASSPVLAGGASSSSQYGASSRNAAGGYSFTGPGGVPITMAQYLAGNGYQSATQIAQAAAQMLSQGTASDKAVAAAISSGKYTPAQLAQQYPQVFGGSF